MVLQMPQLGLAAQLNLKFPGPGPAGFIKLVKTDQKYPALQASHQIEKAVQFIQDIRVLVILKALGFAFDQVQAVGFDQANIDLVFDQPASGRLAGDGNIACDILDAAGLFQVKTEGESVHFQPTAVGGKTGGFIGKAQAVAFDCAEFGFFKQFQQFP